MKPLTDTQIWGLDKPAAEIECPLKIYKYVEPFMGLETSSLIGELVCPTECNECLKFELEIEGLATEGTEDTEKMKTIVQINSNIKSAEFVEHGIDGLRCVLWCNRERLKVIFSYGGGGWEHASVSTFTKKCPTWEQMCFIKEFFWNPDECVIEYHVPQKDHINIANNCLHLWKPIDVEIPIPPKSFV